MAEPIIMYPWPRWLKGEKAAAYSGIGYKTLKKLAAGGEIVGFPDPNDKRGPLGDGVWVFDQKSIDQYRLNQASDSDAAVVKNAILATRAGRRI